MARTTWLGCVLVAAASATACSSTDDGGNGGTGGSIAGTGNGGSSAGVAGALSSSSGGSSGASAGGASPLGGASAFGGASPLGGALGAGGAVGGASMSGGPGAGGNALGGHSSGGANNNGGKGGATLGGADNNGGSSGGGGKTQAGSGGKAQGGAHSGGAAAGGANSGGGGGADPSCPEGTPALCGIVAAHNEARAAVMPVPTTPLPQMTWSASTAAAAQTWADQCNWSHNTMNGMYGQNLYASAGGGAPSPQTVVDSWVSEVMDYDYATNKCSGTCGHYTQVVWRNSTQVGCAVKACTTGSPFDSFPNWYIVVCNYLPPGNFVGQKPY